ncbi:MAG TPA: protein-disulfide reductase DsbD domain-containing protein [Dokdonella sp.]
MRIRPMRMQKYLSLLVRVTAAAAVLVATPAFAMKPRPTDPIDVQLIAEHTELVPGQSQQLALLLRHQPHWHTYWINPGDSGLPTTVEWILPPGYTADEIDWPTPRRFAVGGLYNFGYDGETLLPVSITLPADAAVGSTAHIALVTKWLVCREECIPGKASLAIDLPVVRVAAKPDPRWTAQFSEARLEQPQATAWKRTVRDSGDHFTVTLTGPGLPPASAQLDALPAQRRLFDNKPPTIRRDGDALVIEAGKSEYFTSAPSELDLRVTTTSANGARGWRVRIPFAADATAPAR